ncbi:hypothetical protein SAMN06272737_11719 [Blastococcus mobilis]|uniref:Uncharacterized protein n=1 Tax=Blastococcus mobilis TaxID=1938746 RepID=A0A238Y2B0_9ACTN|nr:hypothetical protein SAMN06272737_11719 [Blastococcus mobilis]
MAGRDVVAELLLSGQIRKEFFIAHVLFTAGGQQ